MMKIRFCTAILLIASWTPISMSQHQSCSTLSRTIWDDHQQFYALDNIGQLALGLGVGAFYANTSFDTEIQNLYHDYIRSSATDQISKVAKQFGNGKITVPLYLATASMIFIFPRNKLMNKISDWGQECSRALILGAPLVLGLQLGTGASRPYENNGSKWHPFKDNNGVSGHCFMGALPFLVAARHTNLQLIKIPLYLGSTLTGLSRINDNQHYFSQAFLGWWIAWLATNSIKSTAIHFVPSTSGVSILLAL